MCIKSFISRYDGIFDIIQKVDNIVYCLNLSEKLKLHPIFHVSYLKPCLDDSPDLARNKFERTPPTVHKEFERVGEWILDC